MPFALRTSTVLLKKKIATEEEKFPQLLAGSTHEHAGAVRLQDMSPASDLPSERRPSL